MVSRDMQGRAFLIIIVGIFTRFWTAFLCTIVNLHGLTWRERLYLALAWCPKASGQGANTLLLLTLFSNKPSIHVTQIACTSLLAMLIFQPCTVTAIANFGPRMLSLPAASVPPANTLPEEFKGKKDEMDGDKK
jgi:hypothetical protein